MRETPIWKARDNDAWTMTGRDQFRLTAYYMRQNSAAVWALIGLSVVFALLALGVWWGLFVFFGATGGDMLSVLAMSVTTEWSDDPGSPLLPLLAGVAFYYLADALFSVGICRVVLRRAARPDPAGALLRPGGGEAATDRPASGDLEPQTRGGFVADFFSPIGEGGVIRVVLLWFCFLVALLTLQAFFPEGPAGTVLEKLADYVVVTPLAAVMGFRLAEGRVTRAQEGFKDIFRFYDRNGLAWLLPCALFFGAAQLVVYPLFWNNGYLLTHHPAVFFLYLAASWAPSVYIGIFGLFFLAVTYQRDGARRRSQNIEK